MSCDVLYVTHPEVHTLGLEPDLGQGVTIQGPSGLYFGLSSAAYYHLLSLFEAMRVTPTMSRWSVRVI